MFFEQNTQSSSFVWTVSELNDQVSHCLQANFPPLWVGGEVRGFTRAASGHWYFTLKDANGELSCAMFAGQNRRVGFIPKTGDHLEVHGQVSVYRARGSYQMVVDAVRQAGMGALYERFLQLKDKLQKEGLFDQSRKKPLKRIYTNIAVVTSLQAAALRDVLSTLQRRASYAKVRVFETAVQGDEAPAEIISALRRADQNENVEVILLVRGGGSIQDLWSFNDESVARTVASLSKPVIVGVGHESDVTIVDWVADLRAATPTAAAEHVTESAEVLSRELSQSKDALNYTWNRYWTESAQKVDSLLREMPNPVRNVHQSQERLRHSIQLLKELMHAQWQIKFESVRYLDHSLLKPSARLNSECEKCGRVSKDLSRAMIEILKKHSQTHSSVMELITELSPQTILKKGYSYVTTSDGAFVKSSQTLSEGENLTVYWHDGRANVCVTKTRP